MAPITIDLVTSSPLGELPHVMDAIRAEFGDRIKVRISPVQLIDGGKMDEERLFNELLASDMILYDVRGNGRTFHLLKRINESSSVHMCSIMGGSPDILGLTRLGAFSIRALSAKSGGQAYVDYTKMKDMGLLLEKLAAVLGEEAAKDAGNWLQAIKYWTNPYEKNLRNLLLSMAEAYGHEGLKVKIEPPIERPDHGIYHPRIDKIFESLDEYLDAYGYDPGKPTVGVLYYGNVHYDVSIVGVKALLERLEPHVNVIPVFGGGVDNLTPMRKYFQIGRAHV
jgi:cobaltochelatase CobN